MKMGKNYPDKYPSFGRRDSMIVTEGGVDKVVANPNNRVQEFSGYKQWDIMQKLLFQQNNKVSHLLNLQLSNSTDVPRYDRLQDKRYFNAAIGNTLRYAEWYYGPQKRIMGAYTLDVKKLSFLDEFKLTLSYQDIEESRQQREYLRYDRFDSRKEHIKVAAFNIDGRKSWGNNDLTMGIDGQLNDLQSTATRTNLTTQVVSKLDTRYPDGKNKVNYFGVFAQHSLKMKSGKLVLNDGIRLQAVSLHSTIVDNSFFNLPVTDIKQSPFAVTGNLGLVYMPSANLRLTTNLSSGFRAPNVDDLARVFESSTATRRVIVPNPDIGPEYTYNFDIGIEQKIKTVRFELTGFYTLFRNAITPAPYKLNGQDSIIYNTVKSAVFANQNVNKAYVLGFNARLKVDISKDIVFDNTVNYTYGRFKNANGTRTPLDHVPPFFGKTSLAYSADGVTTEVYGMFNGWKKIKDYNPNGEDNGQYATPDGMPSWFTLNLRGSRAIGKHLLFQIGVENIFNRNYRYFASGFSAPGTNVIIALRANF
jgi:hemoglobin/transferrin/lactoferrin receptor protein